MRVFMRDVGGETHDTSRGDMFAVPAGMEHDFINTGTVRRCDSVRTHAGPRDDWTLSSLICES